MTARPLRPLRLLAHPLWVSALGLLLLNDHVLKGGDFAPHLLTGKLSDLAGMFVAPPVLAVLARLQTRRGLAASHVAVGAVFAAINLSPVLARAVEGLMAPLVPWRIWSDPTDLVALPMLVVSHRLGARIAARPLPLRRSWCRAAERGIFGLALLACIATSRPPPARVSAGPQHVHVPLGYDTGRLALVDAATGRETERLGVTMASSPRPALVAGVLVGSEGYAGAARGRLVGVDVATGELRFAVEAGDLVSPVLVHGDQVVVARRLDGETRLSSWDVTDGRHLWDHPVGDRWVVVLHLSGNLLLAGKDDRVVRLDLATGQPRWERPFEDEVVAMTRLGDRAYLHLADGLLLALDAATGQERQRLTRPSSPRKSRHVFDGSVVAGDGSLFLLVDEGVMVLDGQLRRRRLVPDLDELYAEQGVVLGLAGHTMVGLDPLSGAPRWRYAGADFWYDAPTVSAGAVYLGGDDQVVAVDAATGHERWTWHYPEDD